VMHCIDHPDCDGFCKSESGSAVDITEVSRPYYGGYKQVVHIMVATNRLIQTGRNLPKTLEFSSELLLRT
jgi:hypothetical protein